MIDTMRCEYGITNDDVFVKILNLVSAKKSRASLNVRHHNVVKSFHKTKANVFAIDKIRYYPIH